MEARNRRIKNEPPLPSRQQSLSSYLILEIDYTSSIKISV
jgi:hypothetical protein